MALNETTRLWCNSNLPPEVATELLAILTVTDVLSSTEAGFIDGVTAGTAAASKAVVLDASKGISTITSATITTLTSTTIVVGTASLVEADLLKIDAITDGTGAAGKAVVLDSNKDVVAGIRNVKLGDPGTAGSLQIGDGAAGGSENQINLTTALQSADLAVIVPDPGAIVTAYVALSTAALTAAEVDVLDGATAGDIVASKVGVVDAYKALRFGAFNTGGATTSAIALATTMDKYTDGQVDVFSVFGASTANLTSAYSAKCGRFRHIVNCTTAAHETYGLVGQLVVKDTTLTHLHSGLMGTFEGHTSGVVLNSSYTVGHAAVKARIGGHAAITATTPLAGFLAFNNASAGLASGISVAFAGSSASATYPWSVGLYLPVGSVNQGIRIGHWKTGGGTGNAIPFSAATDSADTSQLDIVACYGESTTDLTSGISAKVGRFRHLVSGSGLQTNHETYGAVGQLVCKSTTLLHLHAGLMGTLEANTTAVVANSAYTYGVGAIIGRVGGGGLITATKCVCGVIAQLNGAAMASGTSSAFASDATSTGDWDYGMSLSNCTRAFNFVGACVGAKQAGTIDGTHQILIHVDGAAYALPVHAVGT